MMRSYPVKLDKMDISITAKYIYTILYDLEKKRLAKPSKAKLAQYLNLSKQTVYKAFKELEKANLVKVNASNGRKDTIKIIFI
jgi:DNA-binding IscR family transcriptional regulator